MSRNRIHDPVATLDARQADPLQPNSTVLRYPTRAYQLDRASPRHACQHSPGVKHRGADQISIRSAPHPAS